MNNQETTKHLSSIAFSAAICLGTFSSLVLADVPNEFSAGDPIRASEMNENFSELDARVTTLESGGVAGEIAVDCVANENALIDTDFVSGATYAITGTCNGPILVRANSVVIKGDATGSKDDRIVLPSGLTNDPIAVIRASGPKQVTLSNLTLSGLNYLTDEFGLFVKGVAAFDGALFRLQDVDILGPGIGVFAARNATVRISGDTSVTDFSVIGIAARFGGHVTMFDSITVTGAATTPADYSEAVSAVRSGSIEIRGGGTFTPALAGANLDETSGFWVSESSSLWLEDNGLAATVVNVGSGASFNQALSALRSASLRFMGGTINGRINVNNGSYLRVQNADINAPSINVGDTGSLDIRSSDVGGTDIDCGQFVNVSGSNNTNLGLVCN